VTQMVFGRMRPRVVSKHARLAFSWAGYLWRRIGAPLGGSAVLLGVAGVLALDAGTIAYDNTTLMKALRVSTSAHGKKPGGVEVPDAGAQLNAFLQQIPARADVPTVVEKLFVLAEQSNLRLEKGEYRASMDGTAGILRYAITLPVRGPAASVQAYVLQALNQTPSLSLQGIAFKREAAAGLTLPPSIPVLPVPTDLPRWMDETSHVDGLGRHGIDHRLVAAGAGELEAPLPSPMRLSAVPPQPVMSGAPNPDLQSLVFDHGAAGSGELEARVQFVLLVRPQ